MSESGCDSYKTETERGKKTINYIIYIIKSRNSSNTQQSVKTHLAFNQNKTNQLSKPICSAKYWIMKMRIWICEWKECCSLLCNPLSGLILSSGASPLNNGIISLILFSTFNYNNAINFLQFFFIIKIQIRMLVWGDGFYNGPIKTTKTLHPAAATQQHHQHSTSLSLHRTHQLTDLYNSLSAADTLRRPTSAALSPEDLTESEWFYLLCLSFSFPPGIGLVTVT